MVDYGKVVEIPLHPDGSNLPVELKKLRGSKAIPNHVAVIMDGNGRWATERGLARTEGHKLGEPALMEFIAGAIEIGIKNITFYTFSVENWNRTPQEVRFLMGFSREIVHRRQRELNEWGAKVKWVGREPKLWKSVLKELQYIANLTKKNDVINVNLCINYGGRNEIADAATALAKDIRSGKVKSTNITAKQFNNYLYNPEMPDVDLLIRTSGEQRLSNFLPWQTTYAEFVFLDDLWPDCNRETLWDAVKVYLTRKRLFGGKRV